MLDRVIASGKEIRTTLTDANFSVPSNGHFKGLSKNSFCDFYRESITTR